MLRVTNLERSIKWYENVLGCKLVKERDNPDYKYKLAFMGGGSSLCRQIHSCLTRRRLSLARACISLICIYGRGCWRFTGGVICCLQAAGRICMLASAQASGQGAQGATCSPGSAGCCPIFPLRERHMCYSLISEACACVI